jgi:CRISPR system Cascade subunit CasC
MSEFLQLHILTSYPPANLNRDDLSRPKTAYFGGAQRLRVSSQCLKRTWRTSNPFQAAVESTRRGIRTKEIGEEIFERLCAGGTEETLADKVARAIAVHFGKLKKSGRGSETLVFFSDRERTAIHALAARCAGDARDPTEGELKALLQARTDAVDVALFGRMLADDPLHNVDAAAQVAHALTVHAVAIEDDYFSAVDDLNRGDEDRGAGHIGDLGFAAGVFYLYVCVDLTQLVANLDGDRAAAAAGVRGLVEAALTAAPKGKQNSFASRSYASYALAERGSRQPRTLSTAFIRPLAGGENDVVVSAIDALRQCRDNIDRAYGPVATRSVELDVPGGRGQLADLLEFAAQLETV